MKKIALVIVVAISFCAISFGQEYSNPRYSIKGFRNGLDFSTSLFPYLSVGADYVASYQFNPYFQSGIGIGFLPTVYIGSNQGFLPYIPVYLDFRYNLLAKRISPFIMLKAGKSFPALSVPYYLSGALGWRVNKGGRKSLSFSLGVNSHIDFLHYEYEDTEIQHLSTLTFRVFYQF